MTSEVGSRRSALDTLLEVQEHDTAIDRLRHRHDALEQRPALAAAESEQARLAARLAEVSGRSDPVARDEKRLDDEARALEAKAADVEARMYSGEVTSPRELQAMQADVEQLRRHRRSIEDRELDVMEQREALGAELEELRLAVAEVEARVAELRSALREAEAVIDAELAVEIDARAALVEAVDAELLADYERCRTRARGIGAARLVAGTCQGCHLSIPSTEAERIRKGDVGSVAHCDNCGCILVP